MESSLCEKPERHASRRLSDHLMFEGQKQKVYSPEDKVVQPCLTDPFSSDLARPFMKAECGKTACSVGVADGGEPFNGRLLRPHTCEATEQREATLGGSRGGK